jgi:hypothetical protein
VVTTIMAKLSGLLDVSVFKNNDTESVDMAQLEHPKEPTDVDEFTAHGEPTEIGEAGSPDKFEHIDPPEVQSK